MAGRYHLSHRPGGRMAMVLGVPDPDKPHDPGRDRTDGPALIEGNPHDTRFWGEVSDAGYRWVQIGFRNYWVQRG